MVKLLKPRLVIFTKSTVSEAEKKKTLGEAIKTGAISGARIAAGAGVLTTLIQAPRLLETPAFAKLNTPGKIGALILRAGIKTAKNMPVRVGVGALAGAGTYGAMKLINRNNSKSSLAKPKRERVMNSYKRLLNKIKGN